MKDFKYLGYSLFVVLVGSLLYSIVDRFIPGSIGNTLLILIRVGTLFTFGMSLNKTNRRHMSVWKIVLSVVLTIFLALYELGAFALPILSTVLSIFGSSFFVYMLYVWCGYLFVD